MKFLTIFLMLIIIACTGAIADVPNWEQITGTQYTMVVSAAINFSGELFSGGGLSMAGAFGPNGESDCRSLGIFQPPQPPYHDGYWYFTIVGNEENEEIFFKIYDAQTNGIYSCNETIVFHDYETVGSPENPFLLTILTGTVQGKITLHDGTGDVRDVCITSESVQVCPNIGGEYVLPLNPGQHVIVASLWGYQDSSKTVTVYPNQATTEIDFCLQPVTLPVLALPNNSTAYPGETVKVPLYLYNPLHHGIEGIEATIKFDTSLLSFISASLDESILDNDSYSIQNNMVSDSTVSIWIYSTGSLCFDEGQVACIEFLVSPDAFYGQVSYLSFTQADFNELPIEVHHGKISVLPCFSIKGKIFYFSNHVPVSNARISLSGDTTAEQISCINGEYHFENLLPGIFETSVSKTNELGGVSSLDASRIARYGIGVYNFSPYQMIAADVSQNGYITPTDASRVARYGVGLIPTLNPAGNNWTFVADTLLSSTLWPPITYPLIRDYAPLNSDYNEENFIGVRLGDVSGNWSSDFRYFKSNEVFGSLPDTVVAPNTIVRLPLYCSGLHNLEGMEFSFSFDDSKISAQDISLDGGILEQGYEIFINSEMHGKLVGWIYATSANLIDGDGIVAFLTFLIHNNVADPAIVAFENFVVNEHSFLQNTINGTIYIQSENDDNSYEKEIAIKHFPDPVTSKINFSYTVSAASIIQLDIYNIRGQHVMQLCNEQQIAGRHKISETIDTFLPGVYFYKFTHKDITTIQKFIKL